MGAEPVGQLLGPGELGVEVVTRAQDTDEELGRADLPRRGVAHRHRGPGVVDVDALARRLGQPADDGQRRLPASEVLAALAVPERLRDRRWGAVLLPEQLERHPFARPELTVDGAPVGERFAGRGGVRRWGRRSGPELAGEVSVGPRRRERPREAGRLGPPQIGAHAGVAESDGPPDGAGAEALDVLQAEDLSNSVHRNPRGRHRRS